jgi:hypothetical protein
MRKKTRLLDKKTEFSNKISCHFVIIQRRIKVFWCNERKKGHNGTFVILKTFVGIFRAHKKNTAEAKII